RRKAGRGKKESGPGWLRRWPVLPGRPSRKTSERRPASTVLAWFSNKEDGQKKKDCSHSACAKRNGQKQKFRGGCGIRFLNALKSLTYRGGEVLSASAPNEYRAGRCSRCRRWSCHNDFGAFFAP